MNIKSTFDLEMDYTNLVLGIPEKTVDQLSISDPYLSSLTSKFVYRRFQEINLLSDIRSLSVKNNIPYDEFLVMEIRNLKLNKII